MHDESILRTDSLSDSSLRDILDLIHLCECHDNQPFDYPLHEEGQLHWLLYARPESCLKAVLTLIPIDGETVECCAFTRPAMRRNGCFSRLLEQAEEEAGDRYLLFAVRPVPDTLAVLDALSAERISVEHRMERTLSDDDRHLPERLRRLDATSALLTDVMGTDERCELITNPPADAPLASCLLTPAGDSCVCLHHVEVTESVRGQGYGSALLFFLFQELACRNIRSIVLHVSGDNSAAIALYRKTGFRITETLSCYLC